MASRGESSNKAANDDGDDDGDGDDVNEGDESVTSSAPDSFHESATINTNDSVVSAASSTSTTHASPPHSAMSSPRKKRQASSRNHELSPKRSVRFLPVKEVVHDAEGDSMDVSISSLDPELGNLNEDPTSPTPHDTTSTSTGSLGWNNNSSAVMSNSWESLLGPMVFFKEEQEQEEEADDNSSTSTVDHSRRRPLHSDDDETEDEEDEDNYSINMDDEELQLVESTSHISHHGSKSSSTSNNSQTQVASQRSLRFAQALWNSRGSGFDMDDDSISIGTSFPRNEYKQKAEMNDKTSKTWTEQSTPSILHNDKEPLDELDEDGCPMADHSEVSLSLIQVMSENDDKEVEVMSDSEQESVSSVDSVEEQERAVQRGVCFVMVACLVISTLGKVMGALTGWIDKLLGRNTNTGDDAAEMTADHVAKEVANEVALDSMDRTALLLHGSMDSSLQSSQSLYGGGFWQAGGTGATKGGDTV
jgi:hypothetical protein